MSESTRKTVLISEPQGVTDELQFDNSKPYLPYMWAILKSHYERHSDEDAFAWLEPIWRNDMPAAVLEPYRDHPIDVLGLSCYTWNWELQCGIAQAVRASNPSCVIVAGGPEPDYKDPAFFRKHPYIDVVVVKDGEITFQKLLNTIAVGDRDFGSIGGLYMPGPEGEGHRCTGPAEVPTVFDHSPYVDQSPYYERLMALCDPGSFDVILETNRGCPYGCSFCDWGSNTMSKIRRFEIARIEAEIEWVSRMRVGRVMLADANFGILPRDVDIADMLCASREANDGYPRHIFWSAAKNHPDRVIAIARKFSDTGICTVHALSIQHTRKEVLAATARSNISPEKQVEVVKAMMAARVPIEVQLILGIPGDTYELWKACLADLMEWGIHEDYLIQAYRLLPNAPAADAAFTARWEIQTVGRIMYDHVIRGLQDHKNLLQKPERVLVATKTYSHQDWVKMSTYAAFIKAFHNASLTQRIAVYLRLTHGVTYLDFYEGLIERGLQAHALTRAWYERVSSHYWEFLNDADASDHMAIERLPRLPYALHPSRWIYVEACLAIDRFYEVIEACLLDRYSHATNLRSVIDYQRELVILPSFERRLGKTFPTDFDWPHYFDSARVREGSEALGEPIAIPGMRLHATDQVSGERVNPVEGGKGGYYGKPLHWGAGDMEDRWVAWIEQTVVGRSAAAMQNLQEFLLEPVQAS